VIFWTTRSNRHGEKDKLNARDHLIGAEAGHSYAAHGASLPDEGNESSCPWAHEVIFHDVGRNGVVAETCAWITLRVELETGELLVWADLVE